MRAELVITALQQALGSRAIAPGLIFHRNLGSQYGSTAHRQILSHLSWSAMFGLSGTRPAIPYNRLCNNAFK